MKQCQNNLRKLKKMMRMLTHQTPPEMLKMKLIQRRTYWYRNFGNYLLKVLMKLRGFNNRRIGTMNRWMKNLKKERFDWKRNALRHSFTSYACKMLNEQGPMRGKLDFIEEKIRATAFPVVRINSASTIPISSCEDCAIRQQSSFYEVVDRVTASARSSSLPSEQLFKSSALLIHTDCGCAVVGENTNF